MTEIEKIAKLTIERHEKLVNEAVENYEKIMQLAKLKKLSDRLEEINKKLSGNFADIDIEELKALIPEKKEIETKLQANKDLLANGENIKKIVDDSIDKTEALKKEIEESIKNINEIIDDNKNNNESLVNEITTLSEKLANCYEEYLNQNSKEITEENQLITSAIILFKSDVMRTSNLLNDHNKNIKEHIEGLIEAATNYKQAIENINQVLSVLKDMKNTIEQKQEQTVEPVPQMKQRVKPVKLASRNKTLEVAKNEKQIVEPVQTETQMEQSVQPVEPIIQKNDKILEELEKQKQEQIVEPTEPIVHNANETSDDALNDFWTQIMALGESENKKQEQVVEPVQSEPIVKNGNEMLGNVSNDHLVQFALSKSPEKEKQSQEISPSKTIIIEPDVPSSNIIPASNEPKSKEIVDFKDMADKLSKENNTNNLNENTDIIESLFEPAPKKSAISIEEAMKEAEIEDKKDSSYNEETAYDPKKTQYEEQVKENQSKSDDDDMEEVWKMLDERGMISPKKAAPSEKSIDVPIVENQSNNNTSQPKKVALVDFEKVKITKKTNENKDITSLSEKNISDKSSEVPENAVQQQNDAIEQIMLQVMQSMLSGNSPKSKVIFAKRKRKVNQSEHLRKMSETLGLTNDDENEIKRSK